MNDTPRESLKPARSDLTALWLGILASLLLTAAIWGLGRRLESVPHLPDTGASWYYWRLPEPTVWGRATAWGLYALHQVALWGAIYYAQTRAKRYQAGLHAVNYAALGINGFFILLHLLQTHLWYDGLAQDVSIWSSQGSVILMLVMILIMENPRRGLVWGKKVPLPELAVRFVRKYHGYAFAWATVYTFWYHPTEATSGHLIGFLYMFLLFLQGSLFFTHLHLNRWWTLALEVIVLFHGSLVAVMQGNGLWPMFAFGFGGVFVITQMHGLGLPLLVRVGFLALYCLAALVVYGQLGWARLNEIVRIPVIEYVAVFALAWLLTGILGIVRRFRGRA